MIQSVLLLFLAFTATTLSIPAPPIPDPLLIPLQPGFVPPKDDFGLVAGQQQVPLSEAFSSPSANYGNKVLAKRSPHGFKRKGWGGGGWGGGGWGGGGGHYGGGGGWGGGGGGLGIIKVAVVPVKVGWGGGGYGGKGYGGYGGHGGHGGYGGGGCGGGCGGGYHPGGGGGSYSYSQSSASSSSSSGAWGKK